jgi:hypothetical protein
MKLGTKSLRLLREARKLMRIQMKVLSAGIARSRLPRLECDDVAWRLRQAAASVEQVGGRQFYAEQRAKKRKKRR